jgi:S-(hydroxymethyl)glutathione dehydrogenase/alcohol dehydrogenase
VLEISVAKIQKEAPLEKVCLLGCGLTTGYGAVINTAKVEPNSTVVVFGLGGVGLGVIQGAKQSNSTRIIGVDLNEEKFKLAMEMGATGCLNPKNIPSGKSLQEVLIEITDGGADYSFECVGNVDLMRIALECTHKVQINIQQVQ